MTCALCGCTVVSLQEDWIRVVVDPDRLPLACRRGDLDVRHGDAVVTETSDGLFVGRVTLFAPPVLRTPQSRSGRILRRATEEDLARERECKAIAEQMETYLRRRIRDLGLEMRPLKVRIPLESSKALVSFTSEHRVDFRRLVRELARRFHRRVEMRPLGVRDGAREIGALGPCGRSLCCVTFMGRFHSVTVRMVKRQNLSLNPTKISGMCGRLMCCLAHEVEQYPRPDRNKKKG